MKNSYVYLCPYRSVRIMDYSVRISTLRAFCQLVSEPVPSVAVCLDKGV